MIDGMGTISARNASGNKTARNIFHPAKKITIPARSKINEDRARKISAPSTPKSSKAIQNIRALCEEHLQGRYDLEVVDIYQQPVLARGEQIIAAPTLIKKLPAPLRKVVGDLSDSDRVLMGLDLQPVSTKKK